MCKFYVEENEVLLNYNCICRKLSCSIFGLTRVSSKMGNSLLIIVVFIFLTEVAISNYKTSKHRETKLYNQF